MWYNSLDRTKPYLRAYRNQNLWMKQQDERIRGPRIISMHINILRRIAKTYAGVSTILSSKIILASSRLLYLGNNFLVSTNGVHEHQKSVTKHRIIRKRRKKNSCKTSYDSLEK